MTLNELKSVPHKRVTVDDVFWAPRIETNAKVTLPVEYEQLKKTARIDALKLDWKPGDENEPHKFWDSDIAKWIEAVGYSLGARPDPELEALVDSVIDMIGKAQQPDGYFNVHFTVVRPQDRWKNLRDDHELYCAGHLMEAAVAYFEGTGKRKLLDVMCRYANHIDSVFGPEEGKKRGYPGHEEIELALVKLYRATGEKRYLALSKFFIDERGAQPHYFDIEAKARGDDPKRFRFRDYSYNQSHIPVREQTEAVGHSVRAGYLYAGMADVAAETGDETLLDACRRIWRNMVEKRMYLTGGIGSSGQGERFSSDYDLPSETAYAETCAAIALVFFARRMLNIEGDGAYADVMERALYNGVISGISLDGRSFFYVNPLAAYPAAGARKAEGAGAPRREWFGCACCPPNIARLLASLGGYVYSEGENEARVDLYVAGKAEFDLGGHKVALEVKTEYPWKEKVAIKVAPESPTEFTLALRIPGWCRGAKLKVGGKPAGLPRITKKGYAKIKRKWKAGDRVELALPMPVERIESNPHVRQTAGRVAIQRGPVVYCLEEADNGKDLADVVLPKSSKLQVKAGGKLFGNGARAVVITGKAARRDPAGWKNELYRPAASKMKAITIKAIPYVLWANRGVGEMVVWVRSA